MIVIESGECDAKSFDAKILFASQLARHGHAVAIDQDSVPDPIDRNQKYEAAPFLADISDANLSGLILIGGENITDETLTRLRTYALPEQARISVTGRFSTAQGLIGSSSKVAFATGKEADVINLLDLQQQQFLGTAVSPLTCDARYPPRDQTRLPSLAIFVPADLLEDPMTLQVLGSLNNASTFNLSVISTGLGKEQIRNSQYSNLHVFGLADIAPTSLAARTDIAAFFGDSIPGERMASFALDLMASSGLLIDCTTSASIAKDGAPALRGPEGISGLRNYIENIVLPNRSEIAKQATTSDWIAAHSFRRLESALGLSANKPQDGLSDKPKTIFIPTNGNGLGHAQRCTQIAAEIADQSAISFAAFPSCVDLIQNSGFSCVPMVQKSQYHADGYANDLINYLRLRQTLARGDTLVFDGGYVFDSVYRTVIEKSLSATWIRRGLWRAGQVKDSAFDREKAFAQIIVPQEAFAELNTTYTFGSKVHSVGPIVQDQGVPVHAKTDLHKTLAATFNHPFDELVVTMLGGGYATDRAAQLNGLCTMFERRQNCLHLVVVWPGSNVSSGLYQWKNTRVVKTKNALSLCQSADLVVSAAGYNSFHEVLYHAIPTILIPQIAPFMDDQEKRARAASERGLAATVLAHEFLQLEREVSEFLDDGKAVLVRDLISNTLLPDRGNRAAAALIERTGQ